jgi:hypothetical protein
MITPLLGHQSSLAGGPVFGVHYRVHPHGGDGASLGGMLNYLSGHPERLPYAERLRRGQAIGSGLIEGAAKNLIGRRLKANNARWLPTNVDRIAGVCCAIYSDTWDAYWKSN